MDYKKCNHDPKDKNTTLLKEDKMIMVNPCEV